MFSTLVIAIFSVSGGLKVHKKVYLQNINYNYGNPDHNRACFIKRRLLNGRNVIGFFAKIQVGK